MRRILIVLAVAGSTLAGEISPKLLKAMHKVETGGRLGAIKGDNGRALGPFQIHYAYWFEAGISGDYEQCADYNYSVRVVKAYLKKHAPNSKPETLARIHNGGPVGHKKKQTLDYWKKVRQNLK